MVGCVVDRGWTIEATATRFQIDAKTVRIDGCSVAVEVKTIVARGLENDAVDQFSVQKADTVRRYAARLRPPAYRVDLIAVTIRGFGAEIRWVPFVA